MARYRSFLFPEAILKEDSILLDSRESHHLARVFRAKKGETIEVFDGKGSCYFGTLESVDAKTVRVLVTSVKTVPVPEPHLLLLQSESGNKSMDLVLRMATEIGVSAIQPIFTEQGDHQQRRRDKRLRVMIEACKQCGLSHLPELYEPCSLHDWLSLNVQREKALRMVASLEESSRPLLDVLEACSDNPDEVVVAVGPAGDFSSSEYALLRSNQFEPVRLGANVLRVETAAAYILSTVDQTIRVRKADRTG